MYEERNRRNYVEIFIENDKLCCAPYGRGDGTERAGTRPVLEFDEFIATNEDRFGWWHISCGYTYGEKITATLYNEERIDVTKTVSIEGAVTSVA